MRLIEHIQKQHIEEPGVGETLTQMLIDVGLLRPDGTPADRSRGARAGDGRGRGAGGRARRTLDARQRPARRRRKTLDAGIGKRSAFSNHLSASASRQPAGSWSTDLQIFNSAAAAWPQYLRTRPANLGPWHVGDAGRHGPASGRVRVLRQGEGPAPCVVSDGVCFRSSA